MKFLRMILGCAAILISGSIPLEARDPQPAASVRDEVEQWGIFEVALKGPAAGNPFLDVTLTARFSLGDLVVEAAGFYDGEGIYRVRFMPDSQGHWRYATRSNARELDGKTGEFSVKPPSRKNHGPVRVRNTFHFAYADGTPYRQIGTTCYSWVHRTDEREEQTLRTLAASPFNKIRMCVFPQDQPEKNQRYFPFEGKPPRGWDTTRFNPEFFRHVEKRVGQLLELGIEADLILFHPYGKKWGFSSMDAVSDDRYVRYVVARLAAFRNVWWSMANEYDFIREKKETDWDRLFQVVQQSDLIYFGQEAPKDWTFRLYRDELVDGMTFRVDVIDTWNMTTTAVKQPFAVVKKDLYAFVDKDGRSVDLPGQPYMALRIQRVRE